MSNSIITLVDLRDLSVSMGNTLATNILNTFFQNMAHSFLSEKGTDMDFHHDDLIANAIEDVEWGDRDFHVPMEDQIINEEHSQTFLNIEYNIWGDLSIEKEVSNVHVEFTKISFEFEQNTIDLTASSVIQGEVLKKMKSYVSEGIELF